MWIWSIHGFFSIASAINADGTINKQVFMIRARRRQHLRNLKRRFSPLAGVPIIQTPHRDYHYRLIVRKSTWISVLSQLAEEQEWCNFKDEAHQNQHRLGRAYVAALHRIWTMMYNLQD